MKNKEYIVSIAVTGRVHVALDSEEVKKALAPSKKTVTIEDLFGAANDIVSDFDFGPLDDIDWEPVNIETPDGNIIDYDTLPYPQIED